MKSAIITVGKEVLTGKTINTNLATIASALTEIGIEISRSFVIDDIFNEYVKVLDILDEDLIIFTGGLGPTIDDITKESILKYFNINSVIDEETLERNQAYFSRMNRKMEDTNLKQAYFPEDSIILKNDLGTAPGLIFKVDKKTIILFPGPPHELKPMLDKTIEYLIKQNNIKMFSKGFKLTGIGESDMEVLLKDFYHLHKSVVIAPYASVGEIKYVFTSKNEFAITKCMIDFKEKFKQYIYGNLNQTLEEVVVNLLKKQNKIISAAESCTGGMFASKITNVSGSSEVFNESYITYSNEAKNRILNIDKELLNDHGAVSEKVAFKMAENLQQITNADITVSITGIAGPTGGTKEKPVGLVYFGITHKGITKVYKKISNGNRLMVRTRSTMFALNLIRKELLNE
ncbi:MAG: competence/damage-inducible protein A [Candidatus Izemoplasma sp.]